MTSLAFIEGDFAYSLLLGMLAAVNPCGFVLLPTYLIAYLSVADESPTHVRVRRALTVGGSVSLGFLAVFLVVGAISRLFTAWIEMNAKYAALVIGIALIVLGVRMLRGWKPRLWAPALAGSAGARGVRSMAAFGVVYAVASIGCTLGLLTTAVLGSFTRHGVVSGVASVAMYGLGMGVFVTALTVTLAFTKSGLLHASRTVMKVLDRVSSALVIFTGVYLTWYWYTAITEQLDTVGIVSSIGYVQNAVVTTMANIGALSIFLSALLILIIASQSRRLKTTSVLRGSASDIGIGAMLLASVTLMLSMSKPLLIVTDLKMYLLGFERVRSTGQLLPGSIGDFSRSLGISEYPGSLFFNIPWLLATSVPDSLAVLIYGVAASAALYFCIIVLGRSLGLPPVIRQSAGILLPFVFFIPGPLMWNAVARYDPAFPWMVTVATLAVVPIAILSRLTSRTLALLGVLGGSFVFFSNIQFLPTTGLVIASVHVLTFKASSRAGARQRHLIFSFFSLLPALMALPVFLGIYLFSVWRIPEIAVAENIDKSLSATRILHFILPMPKLGDVLTTDLTVSLLLRGVALLILAIAIWAVRRGGYPLLAQIGIHSLWLCFAYAVIYVIGIGLFKMELGLDPIYVQVFAYPIWILLLLTAVFTLPLPALRQSAVTRLALPPVLLLLWTTQWVVRNHDDRSMPAEYPIILSSTTQQLLNRLEENEIDRAIDRTIIIQAQFPPERGNDKFRIRRSSDFSETFLMELSAARIPVLNAYTHMISPITFALTNEVFSDGRPSWRQFSLYDRVNSERLDDFGIRFVLSEVPIEDSHLVLLTQEPFFAHGLFPTGRFAYLYEVLPTSPTADDGLSVSIDKSLLRLRGTFQTPLERTIPIEFSHCLRVRNAESTGSVAMSRGSNSMLHLRLVGEINAEVEYRNSVFQFVNCRIRDFFDYRNLTEKS